MLWYRIFGALDSTPEPAGLEACLSGSGVSARLSWAADVTGWYRADIQLPEGEPLVLERFLAGEEGIRAELNAWAAYLETREDYPQHQALMERAIQTRQLF